MPISPLLAPHLVSSAAFRARRHRARRGGASLVVAERKTGMDNKSFDLSCSLRKEDDNALNLSPFLRKLFKEVLPGKHNFVATLIEGRDQKKRPTQFEMNQVLQPFDSAKFNFTKVNPEEVIFTFEEAQNDTEKYFDNVPHAVATSSSSILINVSPIGYCHVLLIPRIHDCLPQRVDKESFLLAMYVAREARNPFFRVGYNSLGGFATINHLHFQAYYLKVQYPVEKAPMEKITTLGNGVSIIQLAQYPVSGFVFEGGSCLEDLSDVVSKICIFMQDNNRPFNVLISESGKRIFLLPQCYAQKQALGEASQEFLDMRINPAVWELGGHLVLKRRKDYDEASEATLSRFLVQASLSELEFQELKSCILEFLASATTEK
uniref:GDP-L-galactose phosphorylase 1 n=2 Tax=Leersia perrieri TaxID=77586 RepID=A0A0D9V943_9ORYZ